MAFERHARSLPIWVGIFGELERGGGSPRHALEIVLV
jgi:hypothetical protein